MGGAKINYVRLLKQEPTEFIFRKLSERARWRAMVILFAGCAAFYGNSFRCG